jgi:ferredoxin
MDDCVVDIGAAWKSGRFEYEISGDERLGFVVPVFAGTLPGIVGLFLERLALKGYARQYTYGVFTCGASSESESAALGAALAAKSIGYNGSYDLVMPDNFIVWSDIPPKARLDAILANADRTLDSIIAAVKARADGNIGASAPRMTYFPNQEVSTAGGTSKLHADGKCTSCGACRDICPMGVINLDDSGKPTWEGSCTMCLACLHRCPAQAIQHGGDTQNKSRYVNPNVAL